MKYRLAPAFLFSFTPKKQISKPKCIIFHNKQNIYDVNIGIDNIQFVNKSQIFDLSLQ